MTTHRLLVSSLALALLSAGCGQEGAATSAAPAESASAAATPANANANLIAAQIADTLQACSYDGRPVQFGMGGRAPQDCRDMIAQVMNFTGLPQNFDVTEADVPNAAASILLDRQKLPHRVIAFNPQFIELVKRETGGNPWAAVSVMAHEAGHHLAGHTIQPGGSQPPIELEADKFSGFVLYKMGAGREDALKAIRTLVPESVPDDSSHPPRARRIAAIGEGWDQACAQTGRADCANGAAGSAPPPGIVGDIAQSPVPGAASQPAAPATPAAPAAPAPSPATLPAVVVLPPPDPQALPSKGMQFVYDETGLIEPAVREKVERAMFEHAQKHGVEIVTLVVNDLHGKSGDDYAWAMLRQLRVGKLDVGNGAVLVYAPKQQQVGLAVGPGMALAMGLDNPADFAKQREGMAYTLKNAGFICKNGCKRGSSEVFFDRSDLFRRDTDDFEWTIRFQSYADIWDAFKQDWDARRQSGTPHDFKNDPTRDRIARIQGQVVAINPKDRDDGVRVNAVSVGRGYIPVQVDVGNGHKVVLYVGPEVQGLMPGGELKAGGRYDFIVRQKDFSWNPKDTQSFHLLSYAQL